MEARFLLTTAVLGGGVALFIAFYLQWAVKKFSGFSPDYFTCYWIALIGCLSNLFLPFIYHILMASYRKLPHWAELAVWNVGGFLICLFLYLFLLRGPQGRLLSWFQAVLITAGQFAFFLLLSYWI